MRASWRLGLSRFTVTCWDFDAIRLSKTSSPAATVTTARPCPGSQRARRDSIRHAIQAPWRSLSSTDFGNIGTINKAAAYQIRIPAGGKIMCWTLQHGKSRLSDLMSWPLSQKVRSVP